MDVFWDTVYNDSDSEAREIEHQFEWETPSLRSEVARAIGKTAQGKSTGPDDVLVELFKAGGETACERLYTICVALWEMSEWPDD